MIYSASRRTDMPAFHPEALVERVGRSRKLDAIVFWTKDVRNFATMPALRAVMTAYPAIIQFTVTGLAGSAWEPLVPDLATQEDALREVASSLPAGAIQWRFDPVICMGGLSDRFASLRDDLYRLLGVLDVVTVSFPDPYGHAVSRTERHGLAWPRLRRGEMRSAVLDMVEAMRPVSRAASPVRLCCEPELLDLPGVEPARCVDGELFDRLYGTNFAGLEKDAGQRKACGCVRSTDIGSYAMRCGHDCRYCYANAGEETVF